MEEEQPDAVGSMGEAAMLVEEYEEVVGGGEGDEGVEVEVRGEVVLEVERGRDGEGGGEVGGEGGECGERVAGEGDDAGVAACVEQGVGAWAGEDLAAVAAHQSELAAGGG